MKYIKKFETLWAKSIIVGTIYKIDSIITEKGTTLELGQILSIENGAYFVEMKTYIKRTCEEKIFKSLGRSFIKRKATPEEIEEFHLYEAKNIANKYNL